MNFRKMARAQSMLLSETVAVGNLEGRLAVIAVVVDQMVGFKRSERKPMTIFSGDRDLLKESPGLTQTMANRYPIEIKR
jgi:hypothetical protein